MNKQLVSLAAAAALAAPALAQDDPAPSPNQIVNEAPLEEWVTIAPDDLLVMTLAPDAAGNTREVIIQLMPPPFSQGWVENIRTLARAGWYDGISVNRVQDNYVVQWGDPGHDNPESGETETKPLPEGLLVMEESDYLVDVDILSNHDSQATETVETEEAEGQLELAPEEQEKIDAVKRVFSDPGSTEEQRIAAVEAMMSVMGLAGGLASAVDNDNAALISIETTRKPHAMEGWHQRDSYADWVEFWRGWPIANHETGLWYDKDDNSLEHLPLGADRHEYYRDVESSVFWPVHCYGMVGVGRSYSPDTGTGAELYTVIGHAPRHLDRNIALAGRVIAGIEHLSSLPRGKGTLGFYEDASKRTPIVSIRVASDLPESERPVFEYLSTESESFARYAEARANRRDPFFIHPAGGADICNIPVPVRQVHDDSGEE